MNYAFSAAGEALFQHLIHMNIKIKFYMQLFILLMRAAIGLFKQINTTVCGYITTFETVDINDNNITVSLSSEY